MPSRNEEYAFDLARDRWPPRLSAVLHERFSSDPLPSWYYWSIEQDSSPFPRGRRTGLHQPTSGVQWSVHGIDQMLLSRRPSHITQRKQWSILTSAIPVSALLVWVNCARAEACNWRLCRSRAGSFVMIAIRSLLILPCVVKSSS